MARKPRRHLLQSDVPRMFHVYARTVRRAFLCGKDRVSGRDYTERRYWILDRLKLLARSFAIQIDFDALLSNHLHLVLRTFPRRLKRMGREEVARRWLQVFPGKRVLDGNWIEPTQEQIKALAGDRKRIELIRKRLGSISWFMQALCEYVARRSNAEEDMTGRFWEGRFGCREIGDQTGLLVCGVYIDLNQIRAGEATLPEQCLFSSVGQRIAARRAGDPSLDGWLSEFTLDPQLGRDEQPSASGLRATDKGLLDIGFVNYLELLDCVGRQLGWKSNQGTIPEDAPPILERLNLRPDGFCEAVRQLTKLFKRFVGRPESFEKCAAQTGHSPHGIRAARTLLRPPGD